MLCLTQKACWCMLLSKMHQPLVPAQHGVDTQSNNPMIVQTRWVPLCSHIASLFLRLSLAWPFCQASSQIHAIVTGTSHCALAHLCAIASLCAIAWSHALMHPHVPLPALVCMLAPSYICVFFWWVEAIKSGKSGCLSYCHTHGEYYLQFVRHWRSDKQHSNTILDSSL